jgi:hypothetical protein
VAIAWRQPAWADYSGVSRSLAALTQQEAGQMAGILDQITQPILAEEVMLAVQHSGRLTYDGDLTDRPVSVSNGSTTYPNAAYGPLGDALRLGYQTALVSMHSPTAGQQTLAAAQTQATEIRPQIDAQRAIVAQLEAQYREKQRLGRRYSALVKARHKLNVRERRQV